jgi:hypothetical protein
MYGMNPEGRADFSSHLSPPPTAQAHSRFFLNGLKTQGLQGVVPCKLCTAKLPEVSSSPVRQALPKAPTQPGATCLLLPLFFGKTGWTPPSSSLQMVGTRSQVPEGKAIQHRGWAFAPSLDSLNESSQAAKGWFGCQKLPSMPRGVGRQVIAQGRGTFGGVKQEWQ